MLVDKTDMYEVGSIKNGLADYCIIPVNIS